jgi:hypothetical protein
MLAGDDLGDIVSQCHPDGFFYRNNFQHYVLSFKPSNKYVSIFPPGVDLVRVTKMIHNSAG